MKCPKCKKEYIGGYTKCSECGVDLVQNDTPKEDVSDNWIFKFGEVSAKKVISFLFFLGIIPLAYNSVLFGKYLYLNNTYEKEIWFKQFGQTVYSSKEVHHLPLGIIGGFIFFIVMMLTWKVTCELLIIIFRAIETYTQKNKAC